MTIPIFDWADHLALDILAETAGKKFADSLNLTAGRLRLLRAEGERDGINQAHAALQKAFSRRDTDAKLNAEAQADHDDELEHGWAK